MANTKAKIIMGVGITAIAGITTYIVYSAIRKKKIKKKIYETLNDTTSVSGQQGALDSDDMHKANLGFDPLFWRDGKNGILPDTNKLFRSQDARNKAKEIYDSIHKNDWLGLSEDEGKLMRVIKGLKSQGQLSQVTYAYANAKIDRPNGDLAEDVKTALKGTWYGSKNYLTELNRIITALPY